MASGRGRKGRKNRAAALIFPPTRHCGARQDGSGHTAMRCDGGLRICQEITYSISSNRSLTVAALKAYRSGRQSCFVTSPKLKGLAGLGPGQARLAHIAGDGLISGRDPLEAEGQRDSAGGIVPFGLMDGNGLDDPLHGGLGDNGICGAADIFQLESAEAAGRLEFDIDLDEARSVECGAQGFRDQPFVPFPHAGKIDDSKDGNLVIREETNRQTVDSRARLETKRVSQVFVDLGFREFKCDPLRAQAVGIILKSPENYQNVIAAGCFLAGKRRRKAQAGGHMV